MSAGAGFRVAVVALAAFFSWFMTANAAGATLVGGAITLPTVWTVADSPYIVIGTIDVSGAGTLTVDPGVEVRFNGSTGMLVRTTLTAIGSASNPIVFTTNSGSPQPGDWYGIRVESGGSASLAHTTISYGGQQYSDAVADLYKTGPGTLALDHCTLSRGLMYGLQLNGAVGGTTITGGAFANNNTRGIYAYGGSPVGVTGAAFSGNGECPIGLSAPNSGMRHRASRTFR